VEFAVVKKTASGNYVLRAVGDNPGGIERRYVYRMHKKAAVVFDTIARIARPLYLAESLQGELVEGEKLYSKDADLEEQG